uniref:D-lactate dehydrogenase (cytochrome) n=3 Tax=Tetraselmis sp. GSL018 TaxID=582737 RepID=A0A061R4J9_9CHLO
MGRRAAAARLHRVLNSHYTGLNSSTRSDVSQLQHTASSSTLVPSGIVCAAHSILLASRNTRLETVEKRSPAFVSRTVVTQQETTSASVELKPQFRLKEVPQVRTDAVGAISLASEEDLAAKQDVYENMDGRRHDDGRYKEFMKEVGTFVPEARLFTDPVRTFAYGTDASFYRLNPKLVIKVNSEAEMAKILPIARKHGVPVTFRAAGTSLSGQAITDSVLLKISHTGKNFRNFKIHGDGSMITVEPGLIGGEVNRILENHKKKGGHDIQYKIGPDPSSIDSCMVGGIVANNSSGMCCGVSQNTYHTLKDARIVFADGTVLDTADPESCAAFRKSHEGLLNAVQALARRVQADRELTNLIRRKFSIKCTTGYSLNALVDFPADDPLEIVKRLMVGSEGTLGFVSQATYNTVPEWANKASAFIMFPDIHSACKGAAVLRNETAVDAVELFDNASLIQSREISEDLVKLVKGLGEDMDPLAASLLVECRGQTKEDLQASIDEVSRALKSAGLAFGARKDDPKPLETYAFTEKPDEYKVFWDVRKGLIPIVGAARETGTSMLIEDVACPVDKLADMCVDLMEMFQRYGYADASCFGHALEGNMHLVFAQGFRTPEEVKRFGDMMDEMCHIVATKHSGSLKGEHSTGRNMAPFVELEWGAKATELMWELKELFDPEFVLNPGVILNRDQDVHLKSLKPSPSASALVDRCIECGFCESNCPSKDLSLTPRQRITAYREINRLRALTARTAEEEKRLRDFEKIYDYDGNATCAADGMCQEKCPVKINTGELIKAIRAEEMSEQKTASSIAMSLAKHFSGITRVVPPFLNMVDFAHGLLGPKPLELISGALNKASGRMIPVWSPYMPKGSPRLSEPLPPVDHGPSRIPRKVVYLPACVTRMMGPARGDDITKSVPDTLLSLFSKAGYEVVYPKGIDSLCCGMMFNSRGFKEASGFVGGNMEKAILEASENGKYPVVIDTSPCLSQVKSSLSEPSLRFSLYEPVEFIRYFLMEHLEFEPMKEKIVVHVPCSSKKMGIEESFMKVAERCAKEVTPSGIPCCGMAGDRSMRYPELSANSLQHLNVEGCSDGYSTSRTCEMSLSTNSGIHFKGLVYLVDQCTKPKQPSA